MTLKYFSIDIEIQKAKSMDVKILIKDSFSTLSLPLSISFSPDLFSPSSSSTTRRTVSPERVLNFFLKVKHWFGLKIAFTHSIATSKCASIFSFGLIKVVSFNIDDKKATLTRKTFLLTKTKCPKSINAKEKLQRQNHAHFAKTLLT